MAHAEFTEIAISEVVIETPRRRSFLDTLEAGLGLLVEIPAALLVVAEIVILFAGVVARYVLHKPLIWSDELASILFLWLAMLGAAVAFRRGEHMRMTALVARASPGLRAFLDLVATAAALSFLVMIAWPSWEYAYEESYITTPALQIANIWRAAALPVGVGLMALFALIRLARAARPSTMLLAVFSIAAIVALFWVAQPVLKPLGNLNLVIFFVGVVGFCVFAGVPIAFAFGLAIFGYLALTTRTPLMVLVGRMDEGMSHLILLSVPLFVFLGLLIEMTGMARAMVAFLASLLGHVRGGLHYVLVGAMYLVSGISGAKAADMAAVAPVLFPEMKARGARPGDLVALLAATGAQTETIPPSLVLITIGSVTGVSIAALFTGGLLPGVVLAVTLCALVWWRYRHEDMSGVRRATGAEIGKAFIISLPALALPFVIRAAVVEGIATATEVSTIGIVYGVLAGLLVYRRFDWRRLMPMLIETAALSGAILLIIGTATGMAWGLTQSGFSRALAAAMTGLPGGPATFIAVSIVAFTILGSVLEGIPAIVLFGPLLFPIARAVGVHEVHYAMVIILAMGIGLFAPPFGVGYYAACAIGRVDPAEGIRPIWGYLLALLIGLIIVAIFPWISIGFL
ncbi:MAG: TRAP transporter large permease subunit [Bradyrhizobium sp.]|jgi:tripartite ATP-independent transporter DctM subunit|uniref:TRAP transporter large permease subunit n=4 Tax=Bradyrhizobium TaxID=374 RepID=A0ABS5G4G9_9BRAD|nr:MULTISPECIES: TRAP transporter large permease subunit [Bradyrhizobium]RTL99935.1 MAG: TRAP transporter large permease subunit [Bradyrhizobiaceae bacterium]MBR1136215.1 TRAP transporter large permease subunit [Bradyrhizobium denitrificans]MCL8484906.1 TRAP transporter large permease subunit [Bradyrhizobium denitrificans]MDU1495760.1 TRAP transporter large permease subunit [Bradyrhizobium sp.]MDU1545911.1 TRAP transporter large permease subunit [Bradyrhizobium sp.]